MISRIGILERKKNLTQEEFNEYWLTTHSDIARANITTMKHYYINTITNSEQLGVDYARSSLIVDGISQLYFDDMLEMEKGMSNNKDVLLSDLAEYCENVDVIITMPHIVTAVPANVKLLKRMSFIKRREDVTAEKFQREWMEEHPKFIAKMPGVAAYRQSLVLDRIVKGQSVGRDRLPVDGVVELWFENVNMLQLAFGSENGKNSVGHAKTIIDQVTTFLVEETTVL